MKTFNTMEELYEALKPFEPDGAVYIYLNIDDISFVDNNKSYISSMKCLHKIKNFKPGSIWKIPRPVDLTKYIGKVVKCETYPGEIYYRILCERDTDKPSIWKSIEPLTSEDIEANKGE